MVIFVLILCPYGLILSSFLLFFAYYGRMCLSAVCFACTFFAVFCACDK